MVKNENVFFNEEYLFKHPAFQNWETVTLL